ncbi:OTU domain-containing protein 2 [Nakaseomyces bracarensis]|uniref:OTU domain-containing protein 2 n=1 Tax=Nakaseomyces bracarensis TaxID=273131 RepID=A0ABR4NZN7_9SACH
MDSKDEVLARHRKEKKDLQNKITGMKKQATKSKRKEVNNKCLQLEEELRLKHEDELKAFEESAGEDSGDVSPEQLLEQLQLENKPETPVEQVVGNSQAVQQQPKKRRNRQKEKLAKREAEITRMKEEAQKEADAQPDFKKIENEAILELCQVKKLKPYDIQPDGHCLFASVLDQIKTRHSGVTISEDLDVYKLRNLACDYIIENKDDFIPYLFDEATMSLKDINEYTEEMRSTAKWGGEIEILALAKVLDCPISVLMAGRAVHIVNQEGSNPELKLVYYKHSYALGEHYNSLRDE